MVKKQWFVAMEEMAKPAMEALKTGELKFVPERFDKTYYHWLENIRDWCISRQLWWGHRIPAYYCDDCGEIVVAKGNAAVCPKCGGTHDAGSGYPGYLVLLGPVAVLDPGLAGEDEGDGVFLSHGRAGDRLRHHLLLGHPHGLLRLRADRREPVPHGADPRPGARRPGPQDEQIPGQRHRSAGGHRQVRRGRAAHDAGHRQCARQRHALLLGARGGQPQLSRTRSGMPPASS